MLSIELNLNDAGSSVLRMALVPIRSPWVLPGNVFIDKPHAAVVRWGHPSKSELRSRWRLPEVQR